MEQRFGYRTGSNVVECIAFLAGYLALWVMAVMAFGQQQQANNSLLILGFLFLDQILLLHALSLLRFFRYEIVLTEDELISSSPNGMVKINLRDIVAAETYPHILGAGQTIVAKNGEIRFTRRISGYKTLDNQLREIVRINQSQ